jgi:hypothetical protein
MLKKFEDNKFLSSSNKTLIELLPVIYLQYFFTYKCILLLIALYSIMVKYDYININIIQIIIKAKII